MVQTLLINSNHWKHFKNYICGALFRAIRWKIKEVTSKSMEKWSRFCTSLYIFGTWDDVAGFKYEWKVRVHSHTLLINQFSIKPGLWHENLHFLENHSYPDGCFLRKIYSLEVISKKLRQLPKFWWQNSVEENFLNWKNYSAKEIDIREEFLSQ